MTGVVFLVVGILAVVGIFLYFFLVDENKSLTSFFQKFKKPEKEKAHHHKIDTKFIEEWLRTLNIEHKTFHHIKQEIHKKIVGMDEFINAILVNLFSGGNMLVEWFPGLAKTKTIHTFAEIMDMDFRRIQFTPDMLPSDILGVEIYNQKTGDFEVKSWPIFANIILADEINRTTPKVQSALLEAMQERQVTLGWETLKLPDPFFVLATQNPLEQEWTYSLPEAQIDRFLFKILVNYPTLSQEKTVLDTYQTEKDVHTKKLLNVTEFQKLKLEVEEVKIDDTIKHYIAHIVNQTREKNNNILYWSSPRWSLGLMVAAKTVAFIQWRDFVKHEDVQRVALPVLRHRIVLSYDAKLAWLTEDSVLLDIIGNVWFSA